ncbi:GntR family transcriptional regulator [Pseudomonas fluorescens]|uniref:GntR family transcriptional regulator n=1 Tax=Pseudomonas fluorescens TaxID=294 RepID=A0A1T2Z585_PSEFL|nr:GntR family transcriptional regulator [Pseudomonas fluorescens]OPA99800.1 GntR family transcriptional regulator [Pseudomonas fluorescens]
MDFQLDRTLSIPLGTQLRGLVEYAITFGALKPGDRLPSTREMAEQVGVAPMTVAQVYRELKDANLIYSKPGSGTFIAENTVTPALSAARMTELHERVDALIDCGVKMGISASELGALVSMRFSERLRSKRNKRVVLVGNFIESSRDYALAIADTLGDAAGIEATTVQLLQDDAALRQRAADADLILTFAHRRREVSQLLPGTPITNISFIPSEHTRRALASIDPLAKVLVVSIFPEFTALMKSGVQRFASHVDSVTVIHRDEADLSAQLHAADVLIYATGADDLLQQLGASQQAFEYRHVPDAGDIQRVVLPLLE